MKIDYISDLHSEAWIKNISNKKKFKKDITNFINNILPNNDSKSDILIISGDISNFNTITYEVLNELKAHYNYIYVVLGNHDYYLPSNTQVKKYNNKSIQRVIELKEWIKSQNGITLLDGDVIELPNSNGITLGGATGWYDFSYNNKLDYLDKFNIYKENSNDYLCIKGITHKEHSFIENNKVKKLINADIIVTHIPPSFNLVDKNKINHKDVLEMFTFNGEDIIEISKAKYWFYGHIHSEGLNLNYKDTEFKTNCLGVPSENTNIKIKTIDLTLIK